MPSPSQPKPSASNPGQDPMLRAGCLAVLEMLRAGYVHTVPVILSAYRVSLDDVRAYEPTWRQRVGYTGPSLLQQVKL